MSTCWSIGRSVVKCSLFTLVSAMGCATASCEVGTPFKSEEKIELNVASAVTTFNLTNVVGDIEVKTDTSATGVTAVVVKTGKGSTQGEADLALEEITVTLSPGAADGSVEAVATQPKSSGTRGYSVQWTVTLPPGANVAVTNRVGDVAILGGGKDVQITNDVGDITARDSAGGLTLSTRVGDVIAEGKGVISAKSDVGDVSVRQSGDADSIKASARVGDVTIYVPRAWKGRAVGTNNVGDVEIDNDALAISGLSTGRGRAEATLNGGGSGTLEANTQVGDVTIRHGG